MSTTSAHELETKFLNETIEALRDQVDYLEAQLMDTEIQFPPDLGLSHQDKKVVRHLLKRPFATHDSLRAILYADLRGEEPESDTLYIRIYKIRGLLRAHGVEITTRYGEGYELTPDMKQRLRSVCAAYADGASAATNSPDRTEEQSA
ncbi:hypothetical protein [Roseibium album]|uniref:hypothetical protein n=1 Tax=Roseibium album TaxID=311410 RepID=UPI0024935D71|nr:hypothetical protein [Roseibium album]